MIQITSTISIHEGELEESFMRASGPGGQNVNTVATAVELRFDVVHSPNLPHQVKVRLRKVAGRRMTNSGIIVIKAERFRNQERNRDDARQRLIALIRQAAVAPRRRIATRPTKASKERRLKAKSQRGEIKKMRARRPFAD